MLAFELLTDDIPPLKPAETTGKALKWMDDFKVSHLPIVDGIRFIGIISEADLLDMEDRDIRLSDAGLPLINTFATDGQHVFEVVKIVSDQHLSVIPVLTPQERYLGAISISRLMQVIAEMPVVEDPGGIIVLELNRVDYLLSQIASIVESNDAKILGTFITSHPDSNKMQLTVKVNVLDLSPILQTFERYDYKVMAFYHQKSLYDDLKERYDSFLNYLNI
ncbi:MAG: CBS domain-containing protein [Flavobacteriales bacterium]